VPFGQIRWAVRSGSPHNAYVAARNDWNGRSGLFNPGTVTLADMDTKTPFLPAFEQWVNERVADKLMRPNTRTTYLRHARGFAKIAGNKAIGNIGFDDARQWMNATEHLAASTVASRLGALKSFFDYTIRQGILDTNPMSRIERPVVEATNPRPTPQNALGKTLRRCLEVGDRRAHLMLRIGSELGLRRFEIAKINRADINFEEMEIDVLGKGGKTINLPLGYGIAYDLLFWIDVEEIEPEGWMFPNRTGSGPVSPYRCGKLITGASNRVNEHITPHTLRHRAATDMLHTGGMKAAQRLLRHSSAATTGIYAKFDLGDLRPYVDQLDRGDTD